VPGHYRHLLWRLTEREIETQFRGSLLGKNLGGDRAVYHVGDVYFVFGVVLKVNWPGIEGNPLEWRSSISPA